MRKVKKRNTKWSTEIEKCSKIKSGTILRTTSVGRSPWKSALGPSVCTVLISERSNPLLTSEYAVLHDILQNFLFLSFLILKH